MNELPRNPSPLSKPLRIEDVEASVQRHRARRAARARVSAVLSPLGVVIVLLALWEAGTRAFGVPAFLLPPPSAVAVAIVTHAPLLAAGAWVTTVEILLGFLLSVVVGIPLALMIFLWPPFARAIFPLLVSSQAMPKVAIAPLLLVWFGFGMVPKVLIAFLIAFFPVVINTAVGLTQVDDELLDLGRAFGAPTWKVFLKIRLPNALPYVLSALGATSARRSCSSRIRFPRRSFSPTGSW
jgi:NitT/TauT family transport system permease protein